jgi:ABC-2 type transport system permease protein
VIGVRRAATAVAPRRATLSGRLPAGMLGREWLVTLARPRTVVMRLVMPLVLAAPLLAGRAPTFWAGMLLSVLVAMFGAVGSGIGLARARSSGLLTRLAIVPRPAHRLVAGWVLAGASVDAVQLLPVLAAVLVAGAPGPAAATALLASAVSALIVANTLGFLLARLAGGPGEVLLDVAVVLAPLLFLGGLFTGVPAGGWRHVAAVLDPFTYLHAAFVAALGGDPSQGAASIAVAAAAWTVLSLLALAAGARGSLGRA